MTKRTLLNSIMLVLILPLLLLLGGCGTSDTYAYTTTYPDEYKIVVRVSNGTTFNEETFIKSGNKRYYKIQLYSDEFITPTISNQYMNVYENEIYNTFTYSELSGWYIIDLDFENNWNGLSLYCTAPTLEFNEDEKQADATINGISCYVFTADSATYYIAKDSKNLLIKYVAQTSSVTLTYEVQSITTTDVFNGITSDGLDR